MPHQPTPPRLGEEGLQQGLQTLCDATSDSHRRPTAGAPGSGSEPGVPWGLAGQQAPNVTSPFRGAQLGGFNEHVSAL